MSLPALVAHADWSAHPAKRWMARALLQPGGGYLVLPPVRVGALDGFWAWLQAVAPTGPILVGFDFPIGLPAAYADRVGIEDFPAALDEFDGDFLQCCWNSRGDFARATVLPRSTGRTEPAGSRRRLGAGGLGPPASALRSRDREPPRRVPDVLGARR
jgi:hypothetical protein